MTVIGSNVDCAEHSGDVWDILYDLYYLYLGRREKYLFLKRISFLYKNDPGAFLSPNVGISALESHE